MSLRVIVAGPLATVQDAGRFGHRSWGVPISGPFDRGSAAVANALVGNAPGCAVLEMTGFGGIFEADGTHAVAIAGATRGYRAYLAVMGGWHVSEIMRSRSSERPLIAGQVLRADERSIPSRRTDLGRIVIEDSTLLRYLDGPDSHWIEPGDLGRTSYHVGRQSDRMGITLEGEALTVFPDPNRLSAPVTPGTIQMAGGVPMILGPACGTMGGYPHVGQVISPDLDRLGQCRPGDTIRFRRVELGEARDLDRRYRESLSRIVTMLSL